MFNTIEQIYDKFDICYDSYDYYKPYEIIIVDIMNRNN